MKKIKKITILAVIFILISILSWNCSFASGTEDPRLSIYNGKLTGIDDAKGTITGILGVALRVARIVGVGIAVIILMVIGIKYMMASAGERADIKKYAMTYVIGAVVLVSASAIIGIIQKFVTETL